MYLDNNNASYYGYAGINNATTSSTITLNTTSVLASISPNLIFNIYLDITVDGVSDIALNDTPLTGYTLTRIA